MMKIDVNTTTATLIPPRESLIPGSVNAVQLQFTFSDEWSGLTKTCVFSNEIETVPVAVENDIVSVPDEILDAVYRWISVGVTGEDGDGSVVIPTIWCRIGQVLPGASGKYVTRDELLAYWSKQEIDLHTDGDGTLFLANDGTYKYISAGGGDVTHEELEAALALKADLSAFEALSDTVGEKADKSEIITVTTGDGTKYLADDGTYKTITGGGDVTHEELDAAIAPLATKDELSTAVEPLATKTELASATAGLATTAVMNAALALKADKTELASYAKQYDVNQALATKADKTETQTALAQKADKDEIITVTTGTGTLFLADDGTYKPAAGDPPDLSAYLTKTEASTTYATKTELANKADSAAVTALNTRVTATEGAITALQTDKADASALADYETTTHAEATYATKAELPDTSDMLTKTEAGTTYATKTELADYETTAHASATYATKAELPDTSDMLTKTEAGTTYATKTELADKADASALADYETTAHAAATYETKADASQVKSITAAGFAVAPDSAGNVNVGGTMVSRDSTFGSWGSEATIQIAQTLPAGATPGTNPTPGYSLTIVKRVENSGANPVTKLTLDGVQLATSADIPDVSRFATTDYVQNTFESTAHASATYAKKTDVPTFTHTYTGDAQDNWTVTDVWSGSSGELQKITWKEYAATAGSPGELIYTGTDSATSQKRSVRIATYAELGDYTSGFATMQWVQEYIASLDGTNMSL